MPLRRVCKTSWLTSWAPSWICQILSEAGIASLGCYKNDVCNSRISKIIILHAYPWSLLVSGKILLCFSNILPSWRPFCPYTYLFFISLQAKNLHLDSNFIAHNLRKMMCLRHFSMPRNVFTYSWPPSWTPSWIYRNAQWCQSGITRIFQGQCIHYKNQQRKTV